MPTARAEPCSPAAQHGRFLKRVVESKLVFAVSGEEGLARVPSRRMKGREVTLLWSKRAEAERWAPVVAKSPRIKELTLGAVMTDVLPGLANVKRLVGVDWSPRAPSRNSIPPISPSASGSKRWMLSCIMRWRSSGCMDSRGHDGSRAARLADAARSVISALLGRSRARPNSVSRAPGGT